jgi:hypothetical protein
MVRFKKATIFTQFRGFFPLFLLTLSNCFRLKRCDNKMRNSLPPKRLYPPSKIEKGDPPSQQSGTKGRKIKDDEKFHDPLRYPPPVNLFHLVPFGLPPLINYCTTPPSDIMSASDTGPVWYARGWLAFFLSLFSCVCVLCRRPVTVQ